MNYENFTVRINHLAKTHVATFGRCLVNEAGVEASVNTEHQYGAVWAWFSQDGPSMLHSCFANLEA